MTEYTQIILVVALTSINAGIWAIVWCLTKLCEKKEELEHEKED